MGRELKRVPIDFDWPLNKPWEGYVNELHVATKCQHCDGSGYSAEAKKLHDTWYGYEPFEPEDRGSQPFTQDTPEVRAFAERNVSSSPEYYGYGRNAVLHEARRLCTIWNGAWSHHINDDDVRALVDGGRLYDFTHTFTPGTGWLAKEPPYIPTAEEVNLWSLSGMGHDSINAWVVVRAECARLGVPSTCAHCDGEGELWPSAEAKEACENWESTEPPSGDGYQIWETVSEGSPISPVFSTPRDLAAHMSTTKWGADTGTTMETWLAFIEGPGWAPSMVMKGGALLDGVKAIA